MQVSRWGYLEPGRPVPEGRLLKAWRERSRDAGQEFRMGASWRSAGQRLCRSDSLQGGPRGLLFVVLPKGALFVCRRSRVAAHLLRRNGRAARQRGHARASAEADCRAWRAQRSAGGRQQGARGVLLFGLARSARAAAPRQRIHGAAAEVERRSSSMRGGKRYLRLISESAVKMGELIDSLLVFSRMGRAEMLQTRVDLNAIVRAGAARCDAGRSGAERQVGDRPAARRCAGDPNMLQLVFTNLLSNAFKYSRTREEAVDRDRQSQRDDPARPWCSCATTASVSTWRMHSGCSASFSACTAPKNSKGPASDSRTCSGSSPDTADACGPKARSGKARRFMSRCQRGGQADADDDSTNTRIFLGRTYSRSPIFGFSAS